MNRNEFMRELEYLLSDIAESEKQEAIQFYNDYFEDAGVENESGVIAELESPKKVAAIIKMGLGDTDNDTSEYTESGYKDTRFQEANKVPQTRGRGYQNKHYSYNNNNYNNRRNNSGYNNSGSHDNNNNYSTNENSTNSNTNKDNGYNNNTGNTSENYDNYYQKENQHNGGQGSGKYSTYDNSKRNSNNTILIIIICILAIPVGIPIICVAFGIVMAIFGVILGVGIAAFAITAAFLISGVVLVGFGIGTLFGYPGMGIILCGAGLLLIAFGLLASVLLIWLIGKLAPWLIRSIVNVISRLFHRGRGEQ